jgi:hypothetical protein
MRYPLVLRVKRLRLANISREDSVGIGEQREGSVGIGFLFALFVAVPFLELGLFGSAVQKSHVDAAEYTE